MGHYWVFLIGHFSFTNMTKIIILPNALINERKIHEFETETGALSTCQAVTR